MVSEINVFDSDEFEDLVTQQDLRISKALVGTVLKNLNGRKRHVHALSVMIEQEQTVYDITIDRREFIITLEKNLPIYESNELYEECSEIVKGIKFLQAKEKKKK